jgi:hypothetical protein
MYNELQMIWKEAAVVYFKLLFQHLPGGAEKGHENFG